MRIQIVFAALIVAGLCGSAAAQRETYEGTVSLTHGGQVHNSPVVLIRKDFPVEQYSGRTPTLYSAGRIPYVSAGAVSVVQGATIRYNISAVRPGATGADNAIYEVSGSVLAGSLSLSLVSGNPAGLWPGSIDLSKGSLPGREPW